MPTIIEQLADFTATSTFDRLPAEVVEEAKRVIIDSAGCALAATDSPKGRIGIEYGAILGAGSEDATVIGNGGRSSIVGAAFANAELVNALDFDAVTPPGHVAPYVVPGALATAESGARDGRELIAAVAIGHEMSLRIGKAMDYLRDIKDGKPAPPDVFGYSCTVFGAAAAIARLRGLPVQVIAGALGIAGSISPVNSHRSWTMHAPSSTIKYLQAGVLAQSAMTASFMAELGHRGDLEILDDRHFGFPRFIGTTRWEPEVITAGLGEEWRFPSEQVYKPYPHCRILHGPLDVLTALLDDNDIAPGEIEAIRVWGEGMVDSPVWTNMEIEHVHDAQFSIAHGIALGAQRVPPGRAWQDPGLVFSPEVIGLMDKVSHEPHPDYARMVSEHKASRPTRVEVEARGELFSGERRYPKGSPSPDPESLLTTEELIAKFRVNATAVLADDAAEAFVEKLLALDQVDDVSAVIGLLSSS